jgi:acyl-CoA hydrolase
MDSPYDANAIAEAERALKLIASKHPEHRDAIERAIGIMSSSWCRLALVRQAVR